jgi:hypothetical protein
MIICDIDGCLFNNHQRKHLIPEDKSSVENWSAFNLACGGDTPILENIAWVNYLAKNTGSPLIFLTARDWSIAGQTKAQLSAQFKGVDYGLYMRDEDDRRKSVEYKREALRLLSPKFLEDSVLIDDNRGIIAMAAEEYPQLNRILLPSFDCCNTEKRIEK